MRLISRMLLSSLLCVAVLGLMSSPVAAADGYSYGYYPGSGYYTPTYTYPTYYSSYTPPCYTAPKAAYTYEYQAAGYWKGRWYPAGYWHYEADADTWYMKGYGVHPGYASAPPTDPVKSTDKVKTADLDHQLKELLLKKLLADAVDPKDRNTPSEPPNPKAASPAALTADEVAQLRSVLQQIRNQPSAAK